MKAKIKLLKNGKVKLVLYLDEFELEDYCLQKGIQPEGIFRIEIRKGRL